MELNSLRDLFIDTLKDLYSAETQITKALPKLVKAAKADDLRSAFQEHFEQTQTQIERLNRIFRDLGKNPRGKKCKGMKGIIEEGEEMLHEDADPEVNDAALIASAQKVEHYEISAYGTARTYARLLGEDNAASLLEETLKEESRTDEKLTQLAESHINLDARKNLGEWTPETSGI